MTEEEKQAAAVAAQKEADEKAKADEEAAAKAKADAEKGGVDYKAEFEKAKKELGQAQHTIIKLKKDKDESGGTVEVDSVEIEKIAEAKATETIEKFKIEQSGDAIESVLDSLTDNPDERALAKFHYENTIKRTGYSKTAIQNDLQSALLIANRPRLQKTIDEMKQSMISKKTQAGGDSTGQDIEKKFDDLSDEEKVFMKKAVQKSGKKEEEIMRMIIANRPRK